MYRVLCFIGVLCLCSSLGISREPVSFEVLRDAIAPFLPDSGTVVVVYRSNRAEVAGESVAAWDVATGAWYVVNGRTIQGQTISGERYFVDVSEGGNVRRWAGSDQEELLIIDYFPSAGVAWLLGHREMIQSIQRTSNPGGFQVSFDFNTPGQGDIEKVHHEWLIDEQGRLVKVLIERDGDARTRSFEYDDRSPARIPVPSKALAFSLTSVSHYPEGAPDRLKISEAEATAALVRWNVEQALAVTEQEREGRAPTDAVTGAPVSQGAWRAYRLPFLGIGLIMVIVGIGYIWARRRRS